MIDDDAGRAPTASGRSPPTARSCAARRRTPTSSSRPARPCNRFYDACPAIVAEGDGPLRRAAPAARYQPLRLRRPPGGRARHRPDGLGRRGRARDGRVPGRARARRSACSRSGSTGPSRCEHFVGGAARRPCARSPCSTAPRSRARVGEPLYLDVVAALREARDGGTLAASRAEPTVVGGRYGLSSKEFTPAMVKAVFDELAKAKPKHALHGRHRRRRHPHLARRSTPTSTSSPTTWCARSSSASAPTARSAPTRTRSRSSARRPTTTPRATSSTTRRSPGAITISHLRFGPRPIRSTYLIQQGELRRLPPVRLPRAVRRARVRRAGRRPSCSTRPYAPGRGLGRSCPREVQEQIIEKKLKFYVDRRLRGGRARPGMGGRINTIMQTCFFAISGVLPARRGDRPDQEGDREDLRQEGRGGRASATSRRSTPTLANLHEVDGARRRSTRDAHAAADRRRRGARLRPARHRA